MEGKTPVRYRIFSVVIAILLIFSLIGPEQTAAAATQSFIVQGKSTENVAQRVVYYGGQVTSRLDIINGVGAQLTEAAKTALLADSQIIAVTSNAVVEKAGGVPSTDYPDVIGADLTWKEGSTGKGVSVAVIDTGIALTPALILGTNGKIADRIAGWKDFVNGSKLPRDPNGHGTHISGIIANAQKGQDGEWNGVAPGVRLVGVRVLDDQGYGTYERVIQGVQWAIQQKDRYNIRVMNLSLLSQVQSPYWADPLNQAVMKAWQSGMVVVVAAGNSGPGPMTITVPGNNPYVVTVGAFTDTFTPSDWSDDTIAPFSAAGPTLDGFVKPDLVAPGAHMVSSMMPNTTIVRSHNASWDGGLYFSMAGTSQAAAVVSGVSALVLSKHPELTPDQVKYRLMYTAMPWVDSDGQDTIYSMWQMGAGRVNAYDAVTADISGAANQGLDIRADLAGQTHYEGFSYYDEATQTYRLRGDLSSETGKFGVWSGKFGVWSGKFGVWSGKFGVWSGAMGVWSGAMGVWSGAMGVWSGAMGVWSGGFGVWSGGYNAWTGNEPWAQTKFGEASFVEKFMQGKSPSTATLSSAGQWVEEPRATH
jgi:serine protease AprX